MVQQNYFQICIQQNRSFREEMYLPYYPNIKNILLVDSCSLSPPEKKRRR